MSNQTNEAEVRNNDIKIFKLRRIYCHCLRPHIELDKKINKFTFSSFRKKAEQKTSMRD